MGYGAAPRRVMGTIMLHTLCDMMCDRTRNLRVAFFRNWFRYLFRYVPKLGVQSCAIGTFRGLVNQCVIHENITDQ